ncbi:hypothetical protein FN846DRAFT_889459 [Sphaerosporella brunnea]|uniref:DUF7603 domain-containing protein n=1 Tax=Sphaerosporella brunnea TaxID=1250544 RepID=A0A5J5EZE9_9PEZI|nr:hypothetical protein FN846DRAFT_889459 [Sphaerosporella brunnea]
MTTIAAFQKQSFDLLSDSSLQKPIAGTVGPDFSVFTSPPLPPISYSPRSTPVRRKQAGVNSLPLGARISDQFPKPPTHKPAASAALDPPEALPREYPVVDSPTLPSSEQLDFNRLYREEQPPTPITWRRRQSGDSDIRQQLSSFHVGPHSPLTPSHARSNSESSLNISPRTVIQSTQPLRRSSALAMVPSRPSVSAGDAGVEETSKPPKSPSNRFTALFRWGSSSEQGGAPQVPEVPPIPVSPIESSRVSMAPSLAPSIKTLPPAIDISRANNIAEMNNQMSGSYTDDNLFPMTPSYSPIEAIEEEVRIVSADLAASIRREMDLEDLVERLQAEAAERGSNGRRTSDYFSDAGTPVRILDLDTNKDLEAEKMVRKVEQEKAQLRLDMLEKIQEEREKRRAAEAQVKQLEEAAAKPPPRGSTPAPTGDSSEQVKDLEAALEEAKRKLAEERLMKENFEDLLTALKQELEANRNERDNLRDEVVPQLRARVEGLEAEASELQKLMYEHSRMQQELASLKTENANLAAAIRDKSQLELQSPVQVQGAVQAQVVQAQLVQISTSGGNRQSLASVFNTPGTPTNGMPNVSLPLNPKDRESLAERLKDVEMQRDSLHKALKSLRERQQFEAKKSKERIKALELERDRALHPSVKRQGRDKEMSALRREVDRLRRRADDALEQKFVCERSLGTLKMDLEKAEQETSTLRILLQEHDDLIAQHEELRDSHARLSREVSELKQGGATQSVSLQQAYKDLQNLHERSLARLDELENREGDVSERERRLSEANEVSQRAIQELRKSLTSAEVDRDSARVEAEAYRKRAESLQRSETLHLQEERNLAAQLRISSERVEELAAQVRAQLASNDNLRERLADCISRGEQEQRASAKKINDLQDKLRQLEDKVVEAQQQAEDAVAQHEDEIRRIRETHTSQLRRLKSTVIKSPGLKSPLSPLLRSPKLEWTSIRRLSNSDASKTEVLEKRVSELERALSDADDEMAEVVSRMNAAQIEVLELQTERYELSHSVTQRHEANF